MSDNILKFELPPREWMLEGELGDRFRAIRVASRVGPAVLPFRTAAVGADEPDGDPAVESREGSRSPDATLE